MRPNSLQSLRDPYFKPDHKVAMMPFEVVSPSTPMLRMQPMNGRGVPGSGLGFAHASPSPLQNLQGAAVAMQKAFVNAVTAIEPPNLVRRNDDKRPGLSESMSFATNSFKPHFSDRTASERAGYCGQWCQAAPDRKAHDVVVGVGEEVVRKKKSRKPELLPNGELKYKALTKSMWRAARRRRFLGERIYLSKSAERTSPVLKRGTFVVRKAKSSKHNVGILCDCCSESFHIYGWAKHCNFMYIRGPRQHLRLERNDKRLCDVCVDDGAFT
eukprot:scaffold48_cov311-Pinguiococcus_pyrenoidosus.AAC.49